MTKQFTATLLLFTIIVFSCIKSHAQYAVQQEGEFGIGLGAGHYFGDLNTRAHLNRPKVAANLFFRKNINNYIAVRVGATFAKLGYSDIYNKFNQFMLERNLSFNTNVWEVALQGDFNFFRFMPGEPDANFTPYITFGIGAFSYDPYAYLQGQKVYLRPLGTEGQGSVDDRALSEPRQRIGVGDWRCYRRGRGGSCLDGHRPIQRLCLVVDSGLARGEFCQRPRRHQ